MPKKSQSSARPKQSAMVSGGRPSVMSATTEKDEARMASCPPPQEESAVMHSSSQKPSLKGPTAPEGTRAMASSSGVPAGKDVLRRRSSTSEKREEEPRKTKAQRFGNQKFTKR